MRVVDGVEEVVNSAVMFSTRSIEEVGLAGL